LDDGRSCTPELICLDCFPDTGCQIPKSYNKFTIDSWGSLSVDTVVNGDVTAAMQQEIMQNGPITCGVDANPLVRKAEDPMHV